MSTKDSTLNTSPAAKLLSITKSDSTTYSPLIRAIYVGGAGNVVVVDAEGNNVTFTSVLQGTILGPFAVSKVMNATTATSLVGFV